MSFNNNPSFHGAGKARPFKTRTPVGKLKPKFTVPRAGRLNIPSFGKSPNPNGQTKANTPAFRGPAKLPTNFLKNFGTGNFKQSINPLAQKFNGPLRLPHVPRLGNNLDGKLKKLTKHSDALLEKDFKQLFVPKSKSIPRLGNKKKRSKKK